MIITAGSTCLTTTGILRLAEQLTGEITAVILPATAPLEAGQAVQDMAGFAVMTAADNFATTGPGATISSVVVLATGGAPDLATPLAEGAQAGFAVTARDSNGLARVFGTSLQTVAAVEPPPPPPPMGWSYEPQIEGVIISASLSSPAAMITIREVGINQVILDH